MTDEVQVILWKNSGLQEIENSGWETEDIHAIFLRPRDVEETDEDEDDEETDE